jgi:cation-transporting ATPase 13A2
LLDSRTGYQTAKVSHPSITHLLLFLSPYSNVFPKGEMIRQILYPKTQVFRFFRDALIFLAILFAVTVAGFCWSIYKFVSGGAPPLTTIVRVLDLFTIVIPPALPIAMTAGASFAVARLRDHGIYCVVPKTVNIAG